MAVFYSTDEMVVFRCEVAVHARLETQSCIVGKRGVLTVVLTSDLNEQLAEGRVVSLPFAVRGRTSLRRPTTISIKSLLCSDGDCTREKLRY